MTAARTPLVSALIQTRRYLWRAMFYGADVIPSNQREEFKAALAQADEQLALVEGASILAEEF